MTHPRLSPPALGTAFVTVAAALLLSASVALAAPRVNLNTASQAQLDTLPGIGPKKARAIIDWRKAHGGFKSVTELLQVKGIGRKTLEKLRPLVTLDGSEQGGSSTPADPAAGASGSGAVNVNTAPAARIESLKGIGPKAAARVVAFRQMHGPFLKVTDLTRIKGIGDKTLAKFRDRVTLLLDVNRATVAELRAFGFKNAKAIVAYRAKKGRFARSAELSAVPGTDAAFLKRYQKLLRP